MLEIHPAQCTLQVLRGKDRLKLRKQVLSYVLVGLCPLQPMRAAALVTSWGPERVVERGPPQQALPLGFVVPGSVLEHSGFERPCPQAGQPKRGRRWS